MGTAKLRDILFNDVFGVVKQYLTLEDLYNLRRVSIEIRYYIDGEVDCLKDLNLSGRNLCSFKAFHYLTQNCRNIVNINLNKCEWLTNEVLETIILKNFRTLRSISLSNCINLNSSALQPMIINCRNLKKLGLSNNYWLSTGCIQTIAYHMTQLEELDLKSCSMLNYRSIDVLMRNLVNLRVLSLASNDFVGDDILMIIATHQQQLLRLNLFGCNSITDRGIVTIVNNCRKLESISIRKCYTLTEKSMILLRDNKIQHDIAHDPTFVRFNSLNTNKHNMSFLTYMNNNK